MLHLRASRNAVNTFPTELGLGWDAIHPRALLRLSDEVIAALLRILFLCECKGVWPRHSSLVVIALLPKSGWGLRPIGLFPWLPKVWAKTRRDSIPEWEALNSRGYLFAGAGRGAEHAVWKQAARAELFGVVKQAAFGAAFFD